MKFMRIFFLMLFSLFSFLESSYAIKYDGIFDQDIYDQRDVLVDLVPQLREQGLTDEELDQMLVELLLQKKRAKIYSKVVLGIKAKVETLVRAEQQKRQGQAIEGGIAAMAALLDIAGAIITFQFGTALEKGAKVIDTTIKTIASTGKLLRNGSQGARMLASGIVQLVGNIDEFQEHTDNIFAEVERLKIYDVSIAAMKTERDRLLGEITGEVWHKYEEQYVCKKRFLSLDMQRSFENKFLSARAAGGMSADQYLGYFNTALEVATHKKKIGEQEDSDQAARVLLRQFDEHPRLRSYGPEVRHEMKKIIITALYFSRFNEPPAEQVRRPYFRRAFYFFGGPGVGKSSAARTLAEFLGLPFCEKTVFNPTDISEKNLLGLSLWGKPNPSWIGEALTVKNSPEHQSFLNAFLILNDFDRVLVGKDKSANALLLYLLDPDTHYTKSEYFEGQIDNGGLFIILTGNQRLTTPARELLGLQGQRPEAPIAVAQPAAAAAAAVADQTQFDDFGALARRLKMVEFGVFEPEQRRDVYRNQVRNLLAMFALNNVHQVTQEEAVTHAMQQRGLSEGLIELSERYTEYKLRRLEGGLQ